jgi:SAM-dependent methyltransferase
MRLSDAQCYDAALCMDSVICYFLKTSEIVKALSLLREALKPDGLLVLGMWNVLAVTNIFGTTRRHTVRTGKGKIASTERGWYDAVKSIYHGQIDVTVTESGDEQSFSREEVLRVMTMGEVTAYLKQAGFDRVSAHSRPDSLEPGSQDEELVFLASR